MCPSVWLMRLQLGALHAVARPRGDRRGHTDRGSISRAGTSHTSRQRRHRSSAESPTINSRYLLDRHRRREGNVVRVAHGSDAVVRHGHGRRQQPRRRSDSPTSCGKWPSSRSSITSSSRTTTAITWATRRSCQRGSRSDTSTITAAIRWKDSQTEERLSIVTLRCDRPLTSRHQSLAARFPSPASTSPSSPTRASS